MNLHFSSLTFQYLGAIACFFTSFFFIVSSCSIQSDHNALLFGRTFVGMLHGIISVTVLLHIADNSSQFFRRYILWAYALITSIPLVIAAFLLTFVMSNANCQVTTGIIMMTASIFALILMPLTYESIVHLIDTGNKDLKALGILIKLRNNTRQFIRHDFNEFRVMIVEDSQRGGNIFKHGNLFPLILVLLLRLLNAILANNLLSLVFVSDLWSDFSSTTYEQRPLSTDLSNTTDYDFLNSTEWFTAEWPMNETTESSLDFNYTSTTDKWNLTDANFMSSFEPWNLTDMVTVDSFLGLNDNNNSFNATASPNSTESLLVIIGSIYIFKRPRLTPILIILLIFVGKLLFGIPFLYFAERSGIFRNRFYFKACILIGILNLVFSIFVRFCYAYDDKSLLFTYYIVKLFHVTRISFIFVAFGIDTIGYIELTESFSLAKRNGSIALILVLENVVNLIAVNILFDFYHYYYNYWHAVIVIAISYSLLRYMPVNPLNLSLRGARDKYWAPE